jgi:quercetin dioxygenase-like cupin family protein
VVSEPALPTWRYEEGGATGSWEGHGIGSDVSGFVVDAAQGEGPAAHTHPYFETFIVLEGRARFRYGDGFVEAEAGAIVVVPPDTAHGFTGLGPGRLRMVTIHASPRMETTWLEDDDGGEVS